MDYRIEKDTMGEVKVPADKFWALRHSAARRTSKSVQKNASACCEGVCNIEKKHSDRQRTPRQLRV